ncbi:hypothetical protein Taro_008362 [Colocasia esculenta]|uniref:Uncharacterized protein n=1 Tax=Colocasia esculenta TaxID=4460 RepID=A0A843U6R4_COLES|nr:hypothetical protein [Colocasia esculenta]
MKLDQAEAWMAKTGGSGRGRAGRGRVGARRPELAREVAGIRGFPVGGPDPPGSGDSASRLPRPARPRGSPFKEGSRPGTAQSAQSRDLPSQPPAPPPPAGAPPSPPPPSPELREARRRPPPPAPFLSLWYFFNPKIQYKDDVHNDGEVMRGTMNVITRIARSMNERLDAVAEVERYKMKVGIYGAYDMKYAAGRLSPGIWQIKNIKSKRWSRPLILVGLMIRRDYSLPINVDDDDDDPEFTTAARVSRRSYAEEDDRRRGLGTTGSHLSRDDSRRSLPRSTSVRRVAGALGYRGRLSDVHNPTQGSMDRSLYRSRFVKQPSIKQALKGVKATGKAAKGAIKGGEV